MPKACLAFCFSLCLGAARAEEVTRAWHLAVPPGAASDALAISEAPAPSVFTAQGDRLTDLSKALEAEETFGKGSWIVWNETRHLLVVHGNRYTLGHADAVAFLREPHQIGTTLAWYRGIGPGEAVPADAKPVYRSKIVGRSGERSDTRWEHPGAVWLGGIEVDTAIRSEPDGSIADVQMSLDWQEKREAGALRWSLVANFNTEAQGRAERVISQVISPTGERWTITADARDLLLDGTPASKRRWIEADGKAEPVPYRASSDQTGDHPAHRLGSVTIKGSTLTVAEFDFPLQELKTFLHEPGQDSETPPPDPFAASTVVGEADLIRPESCKDAVLPEELKPYAPVAMWDVRSILNGWGVPLTGADCAAYDPRLDRLLVAFQDPLNLERIEQLLAPGCRLIPRNLLLDLRGTTDGGPASQAIVGVRLIFRSGQKVMLYCNDQNDNTLLSLEGEATLGDSETVIDSAYDLKLANFRDFPTLEALGSASVVTGAPTSIHASESDGKKAAVALTLDVDPVLPVPAP